LSTLSSLSLPNFQDVVEQRGLPAPRKPDKTVTGSLSILSVQKVLAQLISNVITLHS
jgi:hypothetical protein